MCQRDTAGMANSADPDQTAPSGAVKEQSDLDLHCLLRLSYTWYTMFIKKCYLTKMTMNLVLVARQILLVTIKNVY